MRPTGIYLQHARQHRRSSALGGARPARCRLHKTPGVSLEEMIADNVIVTNIKDGKLLHGSVPPSLGHQLNRIVLMERKDINAVIHLHVNEVIGYFSAEGATQLSFISEDTPLVLEKPIHILAPDENVEIVPDTIPSFIHDTNCFIMPHHGVTVLGETLSQAYHRITSVVAEIKRLITANSVACTRAGNVRYVSQDHVDTMLRDGRRVVYGEYAPADFAR
ncbi:class II aldolase/adducin family protein [Rhizobium mongolense]|uniref:class II aldolase/adducin family protein n=1 Tax=Rhizobium mongolense TaxID=57676 RepID=UPI0035585A4B